MLISWLVRYGHVVSAAIWVGGYALLAFVIVPMVEKRRDDLLARLAITIVRFLTYAGTLTIAFGLVLITRTNGFSNLFGSAWGSLIITGFVIAIVLLGIGDGALRPALRRLAKTGDNASAARRWAIVGLVLTVLAIGAMTAASYVG